MPDGVSKFSVSQRVKSGDGGQNHRASRLVEAAEPLTGFRFKGNLEVNEAELKSVLPHGLGYKSEVIESVETKPTLTDCVVYGDYVWEPEEFLTKAAEIADSLGYTLQSVNLNFRSFQEPHHFTVEGLTEAYLKLAPLVPPPGHKYSCYYEITVRKLSDLFRLAEWKPRNEFSAYIGFWEPDHSTYINLSVLAKGAKCQIMLETNNQAGEAHIRQLYKAAKLSFRFNGVD